jgi:hypothetical protein
MPGDEPEDGCWGYVSAVTEPHETSHTLIEEALRVSISAAQELPTLGASREKRNVASHTEGNGLSEGLVVAASETTGYEGADAAKRRPREV